MVMHHPLGRWGEGGTRGGLDPRTAAFASEHLGPPISAPTPHSRVPLPTRFVASELAALLPGIDVSVDDDVRVRHSRGMSYVDLLTWRMGDGHLEAPDAVAYPRDHDEVLATVHACSNSGIAVVPIGGATSVTGAITHRTDASHEAVRSIVVATNRLDDVVGIDDVSGIVHVGAGITGPQLERQLAPHGWMLGHFPQSWERASIGGFIAARSSGQASSGYGRIEDMLVGARLATPVGTWDVGGFPAASSGPDLRHLVLGSEGTLGVITSARLRLRALPTIRRYAAALIPGPFDEAVDVLRELARSPLRPTVLRMSDNLETAALLTMSAPTGLAGAGFHAYLRMRRALPGSLVILGWEGTSPDVVEAARANTRDVLDSAIWLGTGPGRAWERGRFHGPYLRDELLDAGYLVETFETATSWANIPTLHRSVSEVASAQLGSRSYVMAHISHTYDTGASLYFTVLSGGFAQPEAASERWRAAKVAITDAIVTAGGAVSHHHGVGRDHRAWLPGQIGSIGMDVLHAIKRSVDPVGVMNPGVLL